MLFITAPDKFPVSATFKTNDELFVELPLREGVIPAPYLARYKWLYVDDLQRFTREDWEEFILISYDRIFAEL